MSAPQLNPQNADFELVEFGAAADTSWDATDADKVTWVTGTASAKKEVYWLNIQAKGTTTEGWIKLTCGDGTNDRFIGAIKVDAIIPTATRRPWRYEGGVPGMPKGVLTLPGATDTLKVSTHVAELFQGRAEWRNYVA